MFMCILKDRVPLKTINPKFMVGVVHGAIVGLFLKKDIKEKQSYVGYRSLKWKRRNYEIVKYGE